MSVDKSNPSFFYLDYLTSEDWLRRKADYLSLVTGCCLCKTTKSLLLHHLHYKNLGYEQLGVDVVPLCKPCHETVHKSPDYQAWNDELRNKFKSVMKY